MWTRGKNAKGYGLFDAGTGRAAKKTMPAHRFAYEDVVGPIPSGLVIDHLCRNPPCVNPAHLEPVTNGTNIRRGESPPMATIRRGVCKNGHPRTPENLRRRENNGNRCIPCERDLQVARRAAGTRIQRHVKDICSRGHRYDEVGWYTHPDGGRSCKACHRFRDKRRRDRLAAERTPG